LFELFSQNPDIRIAAHPEGIFGTLGRMIGLPAKEGKCILISESLTS
jgi:hypothetical protein